MAKHCYILTGLIIFYFLKIKLCKIKKHKVRKNQDELRKMLLCAHWKRKGSVLWNQPICSASSRHLQRYLQIIEWTGGLSTTRKRLHCNCISPWTFHQKMGAFVFGMGGRNAYRNNTNFFKTYNSLN